MVIRRSASAVAPLFLARTATAGLSSGVRIRPAPRYRGTAPRRFGSSPENLWPSPKNLVRASTCRVGWVNMKTTMRSAMAVRPRVKAKPRTLPTATKYSTRAASRLTALEARTVRLARFQPFSTAETRPRPSRSSSRMRSK